MHRLAHGHDQTTEEAYHAAAVYGSQRHYEVAPFHMLTRHRWSLSLLLIDDSIFEALPGRVRSALIGIGRDLAGHIVDFAVRSEQSYLEKLRQNSVVTIAPVDRPSFMKAFEGMAESLSEALSMTRALERILRFR